MSDPTSGAWIESSSAGGQRTLGRRSVLDGGCPTRPNTRSHNASQGPRPRSVPSASAALGASFALHPDGGCGDGGGGGGGGSLGSVSTADTSLPSLSSLRPGSLQMLRDSGDVSGGGGGGGVGAGTTPRPLLKSASAVFPHHPHLGSSGAGHVLQNSGRTVRGHANRNWRSYSPTGSAGSSCRTSQLSLSGGGAMVPSRAVGGGPMALGPWGGRVAGPSTARPVVLSPALLDASLSFHAHASCSCACAGAPSSKHEAEEGGVDAAAVTSEGLSWRRLHMSRAKLKATATTSELLSGFAMVAMVELQINEPTNVPEWLFVMFSVCTTVLVAVHIFALMISTYLLPNIDAVSKLQVARLVAESPHERMRGFIELAWAFSTVLGLFLFLVEVAILCWVKFWDYSFTAAWAATIIVLPVLVVFVAFAVHFYHSLVVHKVAASGQDMRQLEDMKRRLDSASAV